MPSLLEFEAPPQAVKDHILQYYQDNREEYEAVWGRLDDVRRHYRMSSKWGRIALLKLSYMNSVISVRTEVPEHERAFTEIMDGAGIEETIRPLGLPDKIGSIKASFAWDDLWHATEAHIDRGNIDAAHEVLLKNALGVGTVKAPFTLSNLGFQEKMCIDANVVRLLGAGEEPKSSSVRNYEDTCLAARQMFPRLSNLPAYRFQWLIFDYQRRFRSGMDDRAAARFKSDADVTRHDVWFEHALQPISETRKRMDELTPDGPPHQYDPYASRRNDTYGEELE